ncbi:hypothetical protein ADIS_0857 [Lunatimonas lonarensis]|uniref:ABM domain-containing protein n=1 Tax=Lunatimonas lonarensis TaxID=1232681 RepID=R7ZXE7_9BACT|nr:antibiotic biosynthesis monooxygenase [Lunatimonas lonarensis]EON78683.1 hypothetical protein ADIS_0857 [Lunatimonas lonarensis]
MEKHQPTPPYYAVIFTSVKHPDDAGYSEMAQLMEEMVSSQPGYLGHESARDGIGITVSYWESLEAIAAWRQQSQHRIAQSMGKTSWYERYTVRICRVEKEYRFP